MPTVVGVKLRFAARRCGSTRPARAAPRATPSSSRPSAAPSSATSSQAPHEVDDGRAAGRAQARRCASPTRRTSRAPRSSRQREREAMRSFRELVDEHKLDMKPIDVEYLFDGDKIVFYFVAEERVDFRDLVRDLASRVPRAHRHAPGRRARRGAHGRRPRPLRRAAVLRAFRRRVPAGLDPHGQGAGPAAEPLEDQRAVRQTHVLSALRVRRVQGLQVPRTRSAARSSRRRRAGKVTELNTPQGDGRRCGSRTAGASRSRSRRWGAAKGSGLSVLGEPRGARGGRPGRRRDRCVRGARRSPSSLRPSSRAERGGGAAAGGRRRRARRRRRPAAGGRRRRRRRAGAEARRRSAEPRQRGAADSRAGGGEPKRQRREARGEQPARSGAGGAEAAQARRRRRERAAS